MTGKQISNTAIGSYVTELTSLLMHSLCTTSSMKSVVTPGLISLAAASRTSLAKRQLLRIPFCCFLSKQVMVFLLANVYSGFPLLVLA